MYSTSSGWSGIEGKYLPLHGSGIYPWCPILQLTQHKEIPTQSDPLFYGQRFYLLMLTHGACCSPTSSRLIFYSSSPSYSHIFSTPSLKATCLKPPLARNPLPFQTNANPLTSTSSSRGRWIEMDWHGVGGAGGHHGDSSPGTSKSQTTLHAVAWSNSRAL